MLLMGEKAAQGNTGSPTEDEKAPNQRLDDVEAVPARSDDDETLQRLERLRKQYGVSHNLYFRLPHPKGELNSSSLL